MGLESSNSWTETTNQHGNILQTRCWNLCLKSGKVARGITTDVHPCPKSQGSKNPWKLLVTITAIDVLLHILPGTENRNDSLGPSKVEIPTLFVSHSFQIWANESHGCHDKTLKYSNGNKLPLADLLWWPQQAPQLVYGLRDHLQQESVQSGPTWMSQKDAYTQKFQTVLKHVQTISKT